MMMLLVRSRGLTFWHCPVRVSSWGVVRPGLSGFQPRMFFDEPRMVSEMIKPNATARCFSLYPIPLRAIILHPLQDGGYLQWEPENYSRSRYIIIQHVFQPKIQIRVRIRVRIKVRIRVKIRVRIRISWLSFYLDWPFRGFLDCAGREFLWPTSQERN